jgi:OmpA-OmpF porin, OOP family
MRALPLQALVRPVVSLLTLALVSAPGQTVVPPPISLTLPSPGPIPEQMPPPEKGDFRYLTPLQGSQFRRGGLDTSPFWVTSKGGAEIVAISSMSRTYSLEGLSNPLFVTAYHDALTKAGWTIVDERTGPDAHIVAHYSKNGRNIWAALHNTGDGYSLSVADAGSVSSLYANLAKSCHAALYGVLFDANRSTLQPLSEAVLQQVAAMLTLNKGLKLEVQGHTDNLGSAERNQSLSDARAKAVVAWLTQHGIAADRLTSAGYGKTKPVADNRQGEGRAKNRRVEIVDPACTPKI